MSRLRRNAFWAKAVLCALASVASAAACDEDTKNAPEKCYTPPLPIYDIQDPPDGAAGQNPCLTPVGHANSGTAVETGGSATAGKGGKGGSAGNGGKAGGGGKGGSVSDSGGAGGADAGAGGA